MKLGGGSSYKYLFHFSLKESERNRACRTEHQRLGEFSIVCRRIVRQNAGLELRLVGVVGVLTWKSLALVLLM